MKKTNSLLTILSMTILTLFAKGLGMLRQMMMAGIFAADMEGIAFSAASRIPLAAFDMLFATAIVGSFLPIYRGHLIASEKKASDFASAFFSVTGLLTAVFALLGILFARPILSVTAPNLDEATFSLAVSLLRILFPAVFFAGLVYTLIGVMQSHERFYLPAAVSAFSNLFMLIYLVFCPRIENGSVAVYGLAFVYLLSWGVQLLTLMIPLMRMKKMPRPALRFRDPDLFLAGRRALPSMLGAWLIPMMTLVANAVSSYIIIDGYAEGAMIVVFENAFAVFTIGGGLVTYGVCNYLFPKLAAGMTREGKDGFAATARMGLFLILMITLPLAFFVFFTADGIVHVLFLRGNFTAPLAEAAGESLRMLSFALPAYGIIEHLSRTAYAEGKVRRPLIASLCGILAGALTAFFSFTMGTPSVYTAPLAMTAALCTAALVHLFTAKSLLRPAKGAWKTLGLLTGGILLCAGVMGIFAQFFKNFSQNGGAFENFVTITLVFLTGLMVYLIWIFLFSKILFPKSSNEKEDDL